jgi:Fe-Mn family superoxide dismutase
MMLLENKINLLMEKINTTEFLISEMKKIGIEKLPYSQSSLKRFIDSKTMDVHYNGHYKTYVKKLNDALSKKNYGDLELEEIIKSISKFPKTIRNNGGGVFNHALFWKMLSPTKQEIPSEIKSKIIKQYGSINDFKTEFGEVAKERFGSGWCWLVLTKNNKLKIMSTPNQDNPLMNVVDGGGFPLLGLDLWEHAYYLKYQNEKDEYIKNFWDVVNWEFVNDLYLKRQKSKLTESVRVIKEANNSYIQPNGSINPKIIQEFLTKIYPECSPKIITDYDPTKRISSACWGKIESNDCKTSYGVIGGKYAVSTRGGVGEWSVINWFDGNQKVGNEIKKIFVENNPDNDDFNLWMDKNNNILFSEEGDYIDRLINVISNVETKKGTLDRGIELENITEKILNKKNISVTRFCDGDIIDKFEGKDFSIIENGTEKFIQVKRLDHLEIIKTPNNYTNYVFISKNIYRKENIQIFAFVESEKNYLFFENKGVYKKTNDGYYKYTFFNREKIFTNDISESKIKFTINKPQFNKINISGNMKSTLKITESQMNKIIGMLSEEIETKKETNDMDNIMKRELQKLRPIPTEMFAAKEAIDNIITAEVSRGNVNSNRTLASLFNLDLTKVTLRNKFRLNNYYNRFNKSRTRGLDFEGLIAGLLKAEISTDINTPYDLITNENQKISIKIVRNLNESPVLKSVKGSVKNFVEAYQGNEQTKKLLQSQINNENIISFILGLGYHNIAEDLMDFMLPDIDGLLIGVPNENLNIEIFYFDKDAIKSLALKPGNLAAPKTKGSQQLRFKKSVFTETPMDGNKLYGRIYFPIISEEEYKKFFLGDENTKETLNLLNQFGNKYNIRNLGGNLPQDIINSLSSNQKFKQDILKLLD